MHVAFAGFVGYKPSAGSAEPGARLTIEHSQTADAILDSLLEGGEVADLPEVPIAKRSPAGDAGDLLDSLILE